MKGRVHSQLRAVNLPVPLWTRGVEASAGVAVGAQGSGGIACVAGGPERGGNGGRLIDAELTSWTTSSVESA